VALLVGLGLVVLERAGVLPATLATAVRQTERWVTTALEQVLTELGLELPTQWDDASPSSPLPRPSPPSTRGD
jgi:hypothetical protein